jgi:hypothetical protein
MTATSVATATSTSTETPIPATAMPRPTPIPESTVTATKEAPTQVSTLVKDIPFESSDYVFSQAADAQFLGEAGKFPRNPDPNVKPLRSIHILPTDNSNTFLNKYGSTPIFEISAADAQVQKDNKNKAWSLAKIVQTEIGGIKVFVIYTRWENKDGPDGTKTPAGFTKSILVPKDQNVKDLKTEEGFRAFGPGSFIPVGTYIDPGRIDTILQPGFSQRGLDGTAFIKWYKAHQDILYNKNFWENFETTGIIKNEIIDNVSGQKIPFIPVSLISGDAY